VNHTINQTGANICNQQNFKNSPVKDINVKKRIGANDPKEIVGITILLDTETNAKQFRARFVWAIVENNTKLNVVLQNIKFLCQAFDDSADETLCFNQILDHIKWKKDVMNDPDSYTLSVESVPIK
jgi:hypothetical protein